jgi:gamma-glutamylcyclotransferase (GGCT)/AIG2-like uncharacterized protein YtfP
VYYFAYGSNLNWPQMLRRCPSSQFVTIAKLPDYEFGITRHSRLRDCGTANVFPVAGQEVWGAVYDVSAADLIVMDGFEDGYHRELLTVYPQVSERPPVQVLVYVAAVESTVPLPNAEYKRLIVEGATHWRIPEHYIAQLRLIRTTS